MIDLDDLVHENLCLTVKKDNLAWLWHRKIGHASYNVFHNLVKYEIVKGLPEISFKKNKIFFESCTQEKQTRKSFKIRTENLSSKPLELVHMDFFGPTRSMSLSGKKYGYVLVDNFSRFTWVFFLTNKNEAFSEFQVFYRKIE